LKKHKLLFVLAIILIFSLSACSTISDLANTFNVTCLITDIHEYDAYTTESYLMKNKALSNMDISIFLDWVDNLLTKVPNVDSYKVAGSDLESDVVSLAIEIENQVLEKAVNKRDLTVVKDYFAKDPYESLPKNNPQSLRQEGWENIAGKCIELASERINIAIEKDAYDNAYKAKDPQIYIEAYPNGSFDPSQIPDDPEYRAFTTAQDSVINARKFLVDYPESLYINVILNYLENESYETALSSLENAKQFINEFPNSDKVQIVTNYIDNEEWLISDEYNQLISKVPAKMLDAQLMVRVGILEYGATLREQFLGSKPLFDLDIKGDKDNLVYTLTITEKGETVGTIEVTMEYLQQYNSVLVDEIVYKEGLFYAERYNNYTEIIQVLLIISQFYL